MLIYLWILLQRVGLNLLIPANLSGFELRWTVDGGRHWTWDAALNQHTEQTGTNILFFTLSLYFIDAIIIEQLQHFCSVLKMNTSFSCNLPTAEIINNDHILKCLGISVI